MHLVAQHATGRISEPPKGASRGMMGNCGGTARGTVEERVRGTRLGGIGRNRQAQGEFKGRSGGKVVEVGGFLSIPLSVARGNCKDSFRGNGKAYLSCGGIARTLSHERESPGLHYIGNCSEGR